MLRFRMVKIAIKQFAILKDSFDGKNMAINLNVGLSHSISSQLIGITASLSFISNEEKVMILELFCAFQINPDDWKQSVSGGNIIIPKETLCYFVSQTIGTARGILHCKTEGTIYNSLVLPPFDVSNVVNEDMKINLEEKSDL